MGRRRARGGGRVRVARRAPPTRRSSLLTRALAEPPPPERRPGLLLELGLAEVRRGAGGRPPTCARRGSSSRIRSCARTLAGGLTRTLFFTAARRRGVGRVAAGGRRRRRRSSSARRQALRADGATRRRATAWAASCAPSDLEAVASTGDGRRQDARRDGARSPRATSRAGAERCAALVAGRALAARAHRRDPGLFPIARADGAHMADREEAVGQWRSCARTHTARARCFGVNGMSLWRGRRCRGAASCARPRSGSRPRTSARRVWGCARSRETYGAAFLAAARLLRGDLAGARARARGSGQEKTTAARATPVAPAAPSCRGGRGRRLRARRGG